MIQNIKGGDENVFREVFATYSGKLYKHLLLKTKSEYLANEVTQITFIKLWKYRQSLSEEVHFSTQLFQIAKTTLIDELRKEERRKKNLKNFSVDDNIFKSVTNSNNNNLHEQDLQKALNHAIHKLPPVRKKVFQMSREGQLSSKEISITLSISIKTVNKHIQLALQALRPITKDIGK